MTIYRKDYQPYPFEVPTVELTFELDEKRTIVTAVSTFVRKTGFKDAPLVLFGRRLELLSIEIDSVPVSPNTIDDEQLVIERVPDAFELRVSTAINPADNTTGEGLWSIGGEYITQCEPEGFRSMVYSPDRPDVLSVFTTSIIGDPAKTPVLLSNGNPVSQWESEGVGRHLAVWHDPHPKPTYLFALVAGDLAFIEGNHTTSPSGREVTIRIYGKKEYVESGECNHALRCVKSAMKWDEENFGREYDLNLFMVYVSPTFNMGAMENKGLNVFNMKYVLALPETATDTDYQLIDAIIAHEYFHNWSGDRVTVRDWFQLSLKEGFTVYRDQRYSISQRGLTEMIENVQGMRTRQFAEDAGPLAHPIRIEEAATPQNFYSTTVYDKGAEVIRMMEIMLGVETFRKGCDLYFSRHDGQAVTCEDFVKAMEDASGVELTQFRNWYSYAGTPVVEIEGSYDSGSYTMTVRQSCPPTPGQSEKPPFVIPLVIGFVGASGDMVVASDSPAYDSERGVLLITKPEETFVFTGLTEEPTLSLNRRFAPVKIVHAYRDGSLQKLAQSDPDPFARWDAWKKLSRDALLDLIRGGNVPFARVGDVFDLVLADDSLPTDLRTEMLALPSQIELSNELEEVDPVVVHETRKNVADALADEFRSTFERIWRTYRSDEVLLDERSIARRALANTALGYLGRGENAARFAPQVWEQYSHAKGMTDKLAALSVLAWNAHREEWKQYAQDALADFYDRYKKYPNVIDKWLSVQAAHPHAGTLARVKELMTHEAFSIKNPNRIRALVGAFTQSNPSQFHDASGEGYEFLAGFVLELDKLNALVASRTVEPLVDWKKYDKKRQQLMLAQLRRLDKEKLSVETGDKVQKALSAFLRGMLLADEVK